MELSPEPHSPPSTAALERETEQLKVDVAHWKGHCLDAEAEAKDLRSCFKQCLLAQRKLDRELQRQLAALDAVQDADSSSQESL